MNNEDSLYAEQSVIGGLIKLSDPNSSLFIKTLNVIKENNFYKLYHRQIFAAINAMYRQGQHVDLVTLESQCIKMGNNDQDLFMYLATITKETPSAQNIIAYAKIVKEHSIERYTTNKLQELIGMFSDRSEGDVYQRLGLLETTISDISNLGLRNKKEGLKHVSESLGIWLDNRDQVIEDGFDKNAFTSGIESLDDVLGVKGFRKGSLVGVGARPKMGKSAFMMLIANHFALDLNECVAIFSMEMPSVEITERSITNRTKINPDDFYRRSISDENQGRTDEAFSELLNSNMYIDDGSALTLGHIQRESRRIRKEKGKLGLICVDYLTLMEAEKADRNDLAYGMITKALKNLAKELNCVVLMLTQLNRGLENRNDKRPLPSDSRDTGQIEQDVDLWIGLYKESVYIENSYIPGLTEVLVRLNRHGGTGTAFVEMRQGFHVPMNKLDGEKLLIERESRSKEDNSVEFKHKENKQ